MDQLLRGQVLHSLCYLSAHSDKSMALKTLQAEWQNTRKGSTSCKRWKFSICRISYTELSV